MDEHILNDPIYAAKIIFLIGGTIADLEQRTGESDLDRSSCGYYAQVGEGFHAHHFVWVEEPKIPVICHELLHLTFSVLQDRGLTVSDESEEAFTYWFENMLEQVIEKIPQGV